MKKINLLLLALITLSFISCTKNKEIPKKVTSETSTQATRGFHNVKRPRDNVVCRNCHATFKLSQATQKLSHGHSYIECPICHKDYSHKSK